jgi:hypothetical protein
MLSLAKILIKTKLIRLWNNKLLLIQYNKGTEQQTTIGSRKQEVNSSKKITNQRTQEGINVSDQ